MNCEMVTFLELEFGCPVLPVKFLDDKKNIYKIKVPFIGFDFARKEPTFVIHGNPELLENIAHELFDELWEESEFINT